MLACQEDLDAHRRTETESGLTPPHDIISNDGSTRQEAESEVILVGNNPTLWRIQASLLKVSTFQPY